MVRFLMMAGAWGIITFTKESGSSNILLHQIRAKERPSQVSKSLCLKNNYKHGIILENTGEG